MTVLEGQDAIDLWQQGVDAWNAWVVQNPETDLSFAHADFSKFEKVDFEGFRFPDGTVSFLDAQFGKGQITFREARFGSGHVFFNKTLFGEGGVFFFEARFGKGDVSFEKSHFGDGKVSFTRCLVPAVDGLD